MAIKIPLWLGLSVCIAGSGILLSHSIRSESPVEFVKTNALPKEHRDIGKTNHHYHVHFTEYGSKSFYEEGLSVLLENGVWLGLLYDNIHDTHSQYIYYIRKSNGRKIRLSPRRPSGEGRGIYTGWKLNLFIWRGLGQKEEHWYGYCYPGKDEYGEKCDGLPEGWEKKPI